VAGINFSGFLLLTFTSSRFRGFDGFSTAKTQDAQRIFG
jgi:hypothetical protein